MQLKFCGSLLLFCLCSSFHLYAQTIIKGKVIDKQTKLPITNASVYIDNTASGTTTDATGEFQVTSRLLNSNADLVISHLNYQKIVLQTSTLVSQPRLTIELERKDNIMDSVIISSAGMRNWKKWGRLFRDSFIGTSEFAKQCVILNPEVLIFNYSKKDAALTVKAYRPLIIENKALGYRIKVELNQFLYSFQSALIEYQVTTFFQPLQNGNAAEEAKYVANRTFAYKGSKPHFLRALFRKSTLAEGYRLVAVRMQLNAEKERINKMLRQLLAKTYEQNRNVNTLPLNALTNNKDSLRYYQNVLNEPDYVITDTAAISLQDTIVFKNNKASLYFKDTVWVQYIEPPAKAPSIRFPSKRINLSIGPSNGKTADKQVPLRHSIILFKQKTSIELLSNGYYYGTGLYTVGDMAFGKMAYQLPLDYGL